MSEVTEEKSSKRKACSVSWSREKIFKLIELYESHANLWDCSLEQYKNRNDRKRSIDAISNAMGISAREGNDKIHSLRCQFQSISRKRKKSKSGQATGENFIIKWEFYEALKFVDLPTTAMNKTTIDSLINEKDRTYDDLQSNLADQGSSQSQYRKEVRQDSSTTDTSRCNSPVPSTSRAFTSSSSTSQNISQTTSRLKRKINNDQDRQALLDRCLGVMSKTAEIFGDYVADELRNMHTKAPALQRHAKREIQRIILNMNDKYESRLQTVDLTQSQMPDTPQLKLSTNSQFQTSQDKNNPPLPQSLVPVNDILIEDTIDDGNDEINLMKYYENCGSTFYKM